MRTENYKHGVVSILLVFALVFSMVTISAPLASAGDWYNNPEPGGTTIDVIAGENFLIRHVLVWDEPASNGAYTITIGWINYENKPEENFAFLMAEAYFVSGDNIGEQTQADVTLTSSPQGENTIWGLVVQRPADNRDSRDGRFNVDVWLEASGVGGVLHVATDNHPIVQQLGGVIVFESSLDQWSRAPITIDIAGVGCTVDITPSSDNGWTDDVLTYTVTVNNTGEVADDYTLNLSDTGGWTLGIVPGTLSIPASSSDTATLSVTVGSDNTIVTVEADGVYSDNSDTCTATQLVGPRVRVEVEPDFNEGLPGENITYTVVVTNIGTVSDNYDVYLTDDAGWGPHFSTMTLNPTDDAGIVEGNPTVNNGTAYNMYIGYGGTSYMSEQAYLQFDLSSIPAIATITSADLILCGKYGPSRPGYVAENMTVSAREISDDSWDESTICWDNAPATGATIDTQVWMPISYDNAVWDVTAYVVSEHAGDQVVSIGMVSENEPDNIAGWVYTKDDTFPPRLVVDYTVPVGYAFTTATLGPDENDTRTLTVPIPSDAVVCTIDNVTVTAISQVDNTVDDSETVQAHAAALVDVDVEPIDPSHQDVGPNRAACFKVTITNTGDEAENFEVVLSDSSGWNPLFCNSFITNPTDDTHVTEADPDGVADSGERYNMYNGWSATYESQRPYLKFDISEMPLDAKICGATLNANSKYGASIGSYPYTDTYHLVDAMSVADDSWLENELTWTNAPSVGDVLDTENFQGDYFVGELKWYSWEVKSWVKEQWHVNKLVSIALVSQDEGGPDNSNGWFYTKDAGSGYEQYFPYLDVCYLPGDTNTKIVELDVDESVTLQFGVIVPGSAVPSTTDTITVTATSVSESEVWDSEDVTVHAESTLRVVDATVEGDNWQETYKDPLTYVIKIHNAGQIADMYEIIAYDTLGWPLRVEPQEVWLKPSHEAQVALSVTIPYQTPGSTTDDITVWIKGKLASGTFTDNENSQTRVTVQAHAKVVYGVDLEVYPSIHQTGHPGSPLTWLVTVTNTGNVTDTYDLSIDQDVYDLVDNYGDWTGGLDQSTVELDAYEEASILLTLTVPDTEDMRTGVHNDIDVTVVSQKDSEINDTQEVTAQVRQQMEYVPQGEIELQAVAGYVAIDIWPTYYDFGVLNEMENAATPADYFTIRNVGNVYVDVSIVGTDATSKPGEPAAKWTLADGTIGVDTYAMWWTEGGEIVKTVTKDEKILTGQLDPSDETQFDLKIQAPSTFTTPAKMWMKVKITARKLHPQP